jgi:hypothetical protein
MTSVSRLGNGVRSRIALKRHYKELREAEDFVALVARARDNETRPNASKMTSTQFLAVMQSPQRQGRIQDDKRAWDSG